MQSVVRDYLLAQSPDYGAAAVGDFREFPSAQPILYRRDRLSLADQGWFFFSDRPDVIYSHLQRIISCFRVLGAAD